MLAGGEHAMPKQIIVASTSRLTQPCYFLGYEDDGSCCEALWTHDPWQARWIDAAEVKVEVELLAMICPDYCLQPWPLDLIRTSSSG